MSDELLIGFLRLVAERSKLFSIDDRLRLTTSNPVKLAEYIVFNRITPIVLKYLGIGDERLKERLAETAMHNEMAQSVLDWQAMEVIETLSEEGISCVIVKGPVIAALYPSPVLRPYGDIDLFIGREQIKDAVNCLTRKGYRLIFPQMTDDIAEKHARVEMGKPGAEVFFDIQWDLAGSLSLRKGSNFNLKVLEEFLIPHVMGRNRVWKFSPEMLLVYLTSHHVLHHVFEGLIWLADVLLLLEKHPNLDWQQVSGLTRDIRLELPVHYYFVALRKFGFGNVPDDELLRTCPRSLRYRIASRACPPEAVFKHRSQVLKIRRKLLREAFKLGPFHVRDIVKIRSSQAP